MVREHLSCKINSSVTTLREFLRGFASKQVLRYGGLDAYVKLKKYMCSQISLFW